MSSVRQKMAAVQKAQNKSEEEARLGIKKVSAVTAEMLDDIINKLSEEEVAEPAPEKKAAPKNKAAPKPKAKAKAKSAPKGKK